MSHLAPPVPVRIPAHGEPIDATLLFTQKERLLADEEFKKNILPATHSPIRPAPVSMRSYSIISDITVDQLRAELPAAHTISADDFCRVAAYLASWKRDDWGVPREGPLYDGVPVFFVFDNDGIEHRCSIRWIDSEDHHELPKRTYWQAFLEDRKSLESGTYDSSFVVFVPDLPDHLGEA